jgi:hypothetical protein
LAENLSGGALSFLRSRRGLLLIGIILLLGLFLVRPGAQRLRSRIAGSISRAVDRQVEIGSVSLHLLPQPGFDLGNFIVYDDPSFSAEPMLRSDDVTAALRVSSLFRGRLEIARLSLSEPSLNLVRNGAGRWNLEELLERAEKTPIAPTGKPTSESRPAFPYIEAEQGRINFKFGPEKKPYALTTADFSFWQDSENSWGMRLKAQPVRTDSSLSDTGLLRVNGTWRRADTLRQTPIQLTLEWDRAQLGQLTKLIAGNDKGWRGSVDLSATLTGTPADFGVHTEATVEDFRRYDILGGGSLRLTAQCDGRYHSTDRQLSDILCQSAAGNGRIDLNGMANLTSGFPKFHLAVTAQDVPAQSVAAFLRHTKRDVPDDVIATGRVNAIVRLERDQSGFTWSGGGQAVGLQLQSATADTTVALDSIPFSFVSPASSEFAPKEPRPLKRVVLPDIPANRVEVGPFEVALGEATRPALVQGWVARSGYDLKISGDAQVQRALQIAHLIGLPAPRLAAEGSVKLDLQLAGGWSGFAAPRVTGKAQLQSVRAEVRGMNAPLEIASANVLLAQDVVTVQGLAASTGPISWRGSITLPRPCGIPSACLVHFDLHADQLSTDQLNLLVNPRTLKRPWYRFLSPDSQSGFPYLLRVRATGRLSADRVLVRSLAATKISADITLENGILIASDLRGDVLGGRHVGQWKANFVAKPPEYTGSGKLDHFALGDLAETMRDGWVTGTATASYQAKASGLSAADLFSNADATLQVEAHDGIFPHIELSEQAGPLHARHLSATLILHDRAFEIHEGKLEAPSGVYQLSGTASLGQNLDLKLARSGATSFNITGTLTRPKVAASTIQETEAVLKP